MSGVFDWLAGKKTYIVAILGAVLSALLACNVIDTKTAEVIAGVLAALGLGTMRAAVGKAEGK